MLFRHNGEYCSVCVVEVGPVFLSYISDAMYVWLFLSKADTAFAAGEFIAVFDPIDGSKNIDASLPVGSIFGIYRAPVGLPVDESSFLQDGRSLVAAGYCLYS